MPTGPDPARQAYLQATRDDAPRLRESRRIYSVLRSAIRARTGSALPGKTLSEIELMGRLRATRRAVRNALGQLAEDGLVVRQPRVGTVVRDVFERVELGVQRHEEDSFEIVSTDSSIGPGSPIVCEMLGLPADSDVSMAEYVMTSHGQPFCIETCYWAPDVAPRVPFVASPGSDLPAAFLSHFGARLSRADTTVEAIMADESTAVLLDVPVGAPLLISEKVLYDEHDVPREVQFIYYAATRAFFHSVTEY